MSSSTATPTTHLLQVQKMAYRCSKCSLCKYIHVYQGEYDDPRFVDICPPGKRWRFEAYYASGKQEIARGLITGELDYTDKLLHALYTCTHCGGCMSVCAPYSGKDPLKTIAALREKAVLDGKAPLPEHEPSVKSHRELRQPVAGPAAEAGALGKEAGHQGRDQGEGGRAPLRRLHLRLRPAASWTLLQAGARCMQKAGVDFGILGENELCCGSTVLRIGDRADLRADGRENLEMLKALGGQDDRHRAAPDATRC